MTDATDPDSRQDFFANFDSNPFHEYLGLTLEEYRPDYCRLRLTPSERTPTGIGGSVNGGVIATMIDMAVIPAVFAGLEAGGSQPVSRTVDRRGGVCHQAGPAALHC